MDSLNIKILDFLEPIIYDAYKYVSYKIISYKYIKILHSKNIKIFNKKLNINIFKIIYKY